MESLRVSVAVIGGGPAGSSLARKLALLGHSVALIEKADFPRAHIGESLPPSVIPLLDSLGLRERLERAGFLRPSRAIIYWAGMYRDVRGKEQPGFQVDRPRFDAILLDSAREVGVRVLQPATVESIEPAWRIRVRSGTESCEVQADYLADATGRACLTGGRRVFNSPPLLAMWAYWQTPNEFGVETRVESGDSEWFWGAPLPNRTLNATVLIEPKRLSNHPKRELYRDLLRTSKLMHDIVMMNQLTEVAVCGATSFHAADMISPLALKVGEAAFTIDPLSSQGVQAAIGSALHAAACIHTILVRADSTKIAMEFYHDRQTGTFQLHEEQTSKFYSEAASFHGTSFWLDRSKPNQHVIRDGDTDDKPPLPGPDLMLTPSATLVTKTYPCLCNNFIEERPGLNCEESRNPLVFLGDIDVVPMWRQISWPVRASFVLRTWASSIGLQSALGLLATLWQEGYLETMNADIARLH